MNQTGLQRQTGHGCRAEEEFMYNRSYISICGHSVQRFKDRKNDLRLLHHQSLPPPPRYL